MMTRKDVPFLVKTVGDARRGRASLPQLAQAHHLASSSGFAGIAGELNDHIRNKEKHSGLFTAPAFLFGLFIGITSNLLARLIK